MLRKLKRFLVRLILIPVLLIAIIFGAGLLSDKTANASEADFRQQINIGTNNYRASQGLSTVTYDKQLEKIAQAWAQHLADNSEYFHNPNLSAQVFADNSYRAVAENLVAQRDNGTIALQSWIDSDGHRENLLGDYNRQGIGVAYGGKYKVTFVQVFGLKDAPAPTPPPQKPAPESKPAPSKPAPQPKPQQTQKPAPEQSQPSAPTESRESFNTPETSAPAVTEAQQKQEEAVTVLEEEVEAELSPVRIYVNEMSLSPHPHAVQDEASMSLMTNAPTDAGNAVPDDKMFILLSLLATSLLVFLLAGVGVAARSVVKTDRGGRA